jgi:hypothetical protein
MHNYINKRLNDFLSISRKEMDSIFYKLERSIDHLLEELIEEEYIKEVKRFEKIEPNQDIGEISSFQKDQTKNRFREGLIKWLLHQRYFDLIIDLRH